MSIGCSPKSKCAPENKNRLCFLEPMHYYWTKSYIIPPRNHIKSYEILYCPCVSPIKWYKLFFKFATYNEFAAMCTNDGKTEEGICKSHEAMRVGGERGQQERC